jgi:hypothetical protein
LAYNGSVWEEYRKAGAGQVLQVVSATKTDTYTHSSGVTFTNVTGLAATITPSSTSSKILITFNIYTSGNNGGTYFKVTGGNAASWVGDAASNRTRISFGSVNAAGTNGATTTGSYLDSPASTSAITYQVQMAAADNTTTTFINRTATDTDNTANNRSTSTITLMEIAG